MSQSEVLQYLKSCEGKEKWIKTKKINEALGITSASANLNKMFKYGEVRRREVKNGGHIEVQWCAKEDLEDNKK